MLRAGHAPVACRVALPAALYRKRRGVDTAPALAAAPLASSLLGFRHTPRRRDSAAPRVGVVVCAAQQRPLPRSSGERAAEVRPAWRLAWRCATSKQPCRRRRLASSVQRPAARFSNPRRRCSQGVAAQRWLQLRARQARTRASARPRSSTAKWSCKASLSAWPALRRPCS